jgi:hypothetical protein
LCFPPSKPPSSAVCRRRSHWFQNQTPQWSFLPGIRTFGTGAWWSGWTSSRRPHVLEHCQSRLDDLFGHHL